MGEKPFEVSENDKVNDVEEDIFSHVNQDESGRNYYFITSNAFFSFFNISFFR